MVPLNIVPTDLAEDTLSKYLQVKLYVHYTNIRMSHSPINYNLHCHHSKFRMSQIYSISSYYEKFADGKMVCIDDEIPFDIPHTWSWLRLLEGKDVTL